MSDDDWNFEAIKLPAGCWVQSKSGALVLPDGTVIGTLSERGMEVLLVYLDDMVLFYGPQS